MTTYSRGVLLAVTGTFFYGFLGLAIKFSGESSATVWQIMAGRGLLGILLVTLIARVFNIRLITGDTKGMLLIGLFNFTGSALITVALTSIPIFEALILWFLLPAWTTLLAVRFLGERITAVIALCLLMAIGGAVVVLWPEEGAGISGLSWGHLAGLFSALSAAVGFICIRRYSGHHPLSHFFHFCVVALVAAGILQLFQDTPYVPPVMALSGIAVAGLLGGLGQMMIFAAVKFIPPGAVTVISMGEIIVAAVGAYFLFNESVTLAVFCGGGMIIAAAFGINLYNARRAKMQTEVLMMEE